MNRSLLSGLALALLLSACSPSEDHSAEVVIRPVLTTMVQTTSTETIGPFVGTVQPRQQTVMSFQLPGRVLTREVGIGDLVEAGQLLATLDSSVQEYQLDTARGNMASAQAQYSSLAASEARVSQLVATSTASQAQLDAAATARQTAQAQLDQAKANVSRAEDQLSYTRITADQAGVVLSSAVEIGQVVSAGEPILVVAQPEMREAVFDLPESLAARLAIGDTIEVSADATDVEPIFGVLREIAPSASATARLRRIRVTLDAPDTLYRLGSTVEAYISRPLPAPVVQVPLTALSADGTQTSVWVADTAASTVSRRVVTVSSKTASLANIVSGLTDGDIVVTAGSNSLTEGQSVLLNQGNAQ